jgi:hypothetical protein
MADENEVQTETAPKEAKRGIGTVIREAICAGKDNAEALAAAKAEFPEAKTTMPSVNWYRNDMRSRGEKGDNGQDIPTARELNALKPKAEKPKKEKKAKVDPIKAEAEAAQGEPANEEADFG